MLLDALQHREKGRSEFQITHKGMASNGRRIRFKYLLPNTQEARPRTAFMESLVALLIERPFLLSDKNSMISGFCSHFMVEGRPPRSFSAPVATFYGSRFGLHPNSGNRQE